MAGNKQTGAHTGFNVLYNIYNFPLCLVYVFDIAFIGLMIIEERTVIWKTRTYILKK